MKSELNVKTWRAIGVGFVIALIFSVLFFLFFLPFSWKNIIFKKNPAVSANIIEPIGTSGAELKYFYFNKNSKTELKVSAAAYLVGDLNTGEVILSKNQNEKRPIASTSKLMTALVTKEISAPDDIAKVSKKALATPGGNGNFRLGEKIKTTDLLYPLLLESSNDAAEIIAEFFGRDVFIEKMNQEANILDMSSTSYKDPTGLSEDNTSTPQDLFKLAGYIYKEKTELLSITTKQSYSNKNHNWSSTNQFLREDGYLGGKSGFTDPALQTVVSLFSVPLGESGARPVGIVLLHSADRHKDVESIIKYLKKNIYYGGLADANTSWVKQKDGIPEIKEPDFVTLSFAGDIMLDRGVRNSVLKNFNGDYSKLFENKELSAILKKSDIVFANLEGAASDLGVDTHNLYSFRMDPAVIPALAGAGIKILSVGNDHVGDWGREAYTDTLSRLKENEILYTGGGNNLKEAQTPVIIEKYGMKIGFLGFSDKGPESMKAGDGEAGVLLTNNPYFDAIIQNASKQVDYLVVSLHFGEEYQKKHNARQEELAHKAVDNGAKLVIGSNPHVVEDFEVYSPKSCAQSSCVSYIAYSLGNFIFDQKFSQDTMQGGLLEVKISHDGGMAVTKNTVKLNAAFQPEQIIKGIPETIKFE